MKSKKNENLSRYIIVGAVLIAVLGIISLVLISVLGTKKTPKRKGTMGDELEPTKIVESNSDENYTTAVFVGADTSQKQITVYDVLTGERLTFDYSTGTEITDKYNQLITVSQLTKGQIVKLKYITSVRKLISLSISQDIWEHRGVTDLAINEEAKVISYLGKNYSYSDATIVLSDGKQIMMNELMSIDYVTVRGWEENIYSIVVTGGHGYIELMGQQQFIGGMLYVGTQSVHQITEELTVPVREGKVEITVSNKQTEGIKEVEIIRDKTTYCDLSEFNLVPVEEGTILFQITPAGAKLWIDNEDTPYGSGVPLTVGQHQVEVTLGGYITYSGTINVTNVTSVVTIALQEGQQNDGNPADATITPTPSTNTKKEDEELDEQEEWNDRYNGDNSSEEEPEDDPDEVIESGTDYDHTITIQWKSGTDVFFNSEYVGTIENGELTVEKQYGEISVDLYLDGNTITQNITVYDDGEDFIIRFPE